MIAHDPVADAEPEPGSLADVAGREEWIEDAPEIAVLDAVPRVRHRDLHGAGVGDVRRADLEPPRRAPAHRLFGVEHEVQQRLLQLARVREHARETPLERHLDVHEPRAHVGGVDHARR